MRRNWIWFALAVAGCGHLGIEIEEDGEDPRHEVDAAGGTSTQDPPSGGTGGSGGEGTGGSGGEGTGGSGGEGSGGEVHLGGDTSLGGMGGGAEIPPPDCAPECERVRTGLILLYDFDEGEGSVVRDTAPLQPSLDLYIPESAPVTWLAQGISIDGTARLASEAPATKLAEAVAVTNEVSLEAWVRPKDPLQSGPARFFTVSHDTFERNFQLGQEGGRFAARLRTTATEANGMPNFLSERLVTTELTHVVYTRARNGVEKLFVNGQLAASDVRDGELSNWDFSYRLAVGDEFGEERREWQGEIHLISVYDRALSSTEVQMNFWGAR